MCDPPFTELVWPGEELKDLEIMEACWSHDGLDVTLRCVLNSFPGPRITRPKCFERFIIILLIFF